MQIHQIAVRSIATDAHVIIWVMGAADRLSALHATGNVRCIALDLDPDRVHEAMSAGGKRGLR